MATTLYGADGRPIDLSALAVERATQTLTGVRTVWHDPVASRLTPVRLAQVLRDAAEGDAVAYLTLAEEMEERDLHYESVLSTRKLAVTGLTLSVESPSDDAKAVAIADAVTELMHSPETSNALDDLLDALAKGYSAVELIWQRAASRWTPRFAWRDPRFFQFDRVTGHELRLRDDSAPIDGLPLEPYKWIVHRPRLKTGIPIRGGLARLVAASYMAKSFTLKDWLAFAEVFGMPLRIGRHGPQATDADIRTLINAVANLGSDAAAVLPDSMRIEFEPAPNGAGGPDLFSGLAEFLDKQVSKAVLGQTMTTDDGSSLAQAKVHDDVREDIRNRDAQQLANTLVRDLVRPFVDLNFGPQRLYPALRFDTEKPEDLKSLADSLIPFIDHGLPVEASVILDKFRLQMPAKGALLLGKAASATPTPGKPSLNRAGAVDPLDALVADGLDDWQPQLEPVVGPLRALFASSSSFEELKRGLDGLADKVDQRLLARELARFMLQARGVGESGA